MARRTRCHSSSSGLIVSAVVRQQCLYFLPLPQGQGSLRPGLAVVFMLISFLFQTSGAPCSAPRHFERLGGIRQTVLGFHSTRLSVEHTCNAANWLPPP